MARYIHTVDAKGRVVVPSRVRNNLDGTVYITLSLDEGYLSAYNTEQFEDILEQMRAMSGTDPEFRKFRRFFLGSAVACELDNQGRISLSDELWQHIHVEKGDEICFIDMFDKVEICSKAFYDREFEHDIDLSEIELSRFDVKGL